MVICLEMGGKRKEGFSWPTENWISLLIGMNIEFKEAQL